MKKILLIVTMLVLGCSVASASPLMDYSAGKVAVDVASRPNQSNDWSGLTSYGGKGGNYDLGLTFGLGDKFALQIAHQKANSKLFTAANQTLTVSNGNTETTANQINILYKLDKNFAAFAGYTHSRTDLTFSAGSIIKGRYFFVGSSAQGKNANGYQIGFVASAPLGDRLTGYAVAGVGNRIENFEFGVGYALAANTELNLYYRSTKHKDLEFHNITDYKYDLKISGIGYGLTFKF
ncbi:hypothetical protein [Anaeroselena agilis]|uniref:Outer membrane protein beta-barrel domain-containing protein n=1 Tax=Anaeroselena agilis TaxID=3063788 RepID=A0ABU3P1C6_9FIRM|nr:hypothetical protein [Selenomonadales bacterium 4137-cl]